MSDRTTNGMSESDHPLPWHFNVHDMPDSIPRKLGEGIQANIVSSPNVMVSVVRFAPNTASAVHSHAEEQWGVLLEGSCTRLQGSEAVDMQVGDFWCTPGGIEHGLVAGSQGAMTLEIFCPPRSVYRVAGRGVGGGGHVRTEST